QTPGGDISIIARGIPNLHVVSVDGTDFFASLDAMRDAVAHVRVRRGPAFVHAHVIRPYSHSQSDDEKAYKTPAERAAEASRDPLKRFADLLRAEHHATDAQLAAIAAEVDREIDDAVHAALKAPQPKPGTAAQFLFSPTVDPTSSAFESPARLE